MDFSLLEKLHKNPDLFAGLSIVAVGDIALDRSFFCRDAAPGFHATHAQETIYDIETDDSGMIGSVGNTVYFARSLGVETHLFTLVGQDDEGDRVRKILEDDGIPHTLLQLAGVQTVSRYRFFVYDAAQRGYSFRYRMDKEDADMTASYHAAAGEVREAEYLAGFREVVEKCDAIYFNDTMKGFLSPQVLRMMSIEILAAQAKRKEAGKTGPIVLVDPKSDWRKFKSLPVDVLKPNAKEACNALGLPWHAPRWETREGLVDFARHLLDEYGEWFPTVLVTLGRGGAALVDAGEEGGRLQRYPAVDLVPVAYHASTHCGDIFGTALLMALALGAERHAAISFAIAVGAMQYAQPSTHRAERSDLLRPNYLETLRHKAPSPIFLSRNLSTAE